MINRAFWIWNIPNTEGGDPLLIAGEAVKAGLTDVFVKVADGPVKFGIYNGKDYVPATVAALKAVGIKVWGWQYCYGNDPAGEEKVASLRMKELGLTSYIVDAETEFKKSGWGARAETYLTRLKANNPGVTIAFSSFRFPHYHPEFPWAIFYKYCDINMPQVYWLQAHNAKDQTEICFQKFEAMGKMPIIPAGPAWKENGWRPTVQEIADFEAVAEKHGSKLVSYWDWEQCRRDLPELWPKAPVVVTPPADDAAKQRLARIEQKILDLEKALSGLSTVVTDLKAILE